MSQTVFDENDFINLLPKIFGFIKISIKIHREIIQ